MMFKLERVLDGWYGVTGWVIDGAGDQEETRRRKVRREVRRGEGVRDGKNTLVAYGTV